MAKKQTTGTSRKKNKNESKEIYSLEGFGKKELFSFSIGILLFVFSFFLLIAFSSYLYSGHSDFDILENPSYEEIQNSADAPVFKNVCGSLGAMVAYFFIGKCFGLASYLIPVFLVILGMKLMKVYKVRIIKWFILLSLLLVWSSVFLSSIAAMLPFFDTSFINPGGNHGKFVSNWLTSLIGKPGLFGVLFLFAVFYLIYLSAKTIEYIRSLFRFNIIKKIKERRKSEKREDENAVNEVIETEPDPQSFENPETQVLEFPIDDEPRVIDIDEVPDTVFYRPEMDDLKVEKEQGKDKEGNDKKDDVDLQIERNDNPEQAKGSLVKGDIKTPYDPKLDLEYYKYPTLSLLDKGENANPMIDMAEQKANKDRIINVLRSFGVEISSIKATIGPTITLYEITPAEGTRINKIRNLEDDIALSLAAEGIRIIAPIPGKGTIGIEVPNKKKCIVSMESILNSKAYQETTMELPCALGKTITNEVFMVDLAKAPHMLVAGATGMGKSVGLNAIVTSLLYKKHPSELKIVMVDPKKVEFSIYSPIENHFLARLEEEDEAIITDVQKVVKTLNSLCAMMDSRYDLLKKAKVRNIKEYNEKFKKRELNPENGHEFMPYIVVIIDEFGDLIMTAGKEIELPICRIAQLARAVGIHMIIATQRPTTNIITGTIKANFPARIAFRVAAMMDSRTILDRPGANQLIGRGDMLYLQGADPVRVQCAFVDTPEVSRICQYISQQQGYLHPMYLPEVLTEDAGLGNENTADIKQLDPMFDEVAKLVVSTQQGSTSLIQRKFSIGYNRAGRLMDQLEKVGVVGSQQGSKPREVLIQDLLTLEGILNTLH
ncbi:MAG: DNA translocase FtsK 4TM domain-containing protein [Bacteroidaceae bacterium]|nr:DNA translocase FtsK 4TM domain-containing protein [Bacteroidaceae bacterium]